MQETTDPTYSWLARWLIYFFAALTGSASAQVLSKESLTTRRSVILTLVGLSAAMFLTPMLCEVMHISEDSVHTRGGLTWIAGIGGITLCKMAMGFVDSNGFAAFVEKLFNSQKPPL